MAPSDWFEFNAAIAAAAAALLGLLFVAVSINAAESLGPGHETSRRLAEQAFQNYLTVLTIALVALIPDTSTAALGQATLCLTLISGILAVVRLYRALTQPHSFRDKGLALRRHAVSILGYFLLLYAAARMMFGDPNHRDMFSASLIVLLASATVVSWELLLGLARRKPGGPAD